MIICHTSAGTFSINKNQYGTRNNISWDAYNSEPWTFHWMLDWVNSALKAGGPEYVREILSRQSNHVCQKQFAVMCQWDCENHCLEGDVS